MKKNEKKLCLINIFLYFCKKKRNKKIEKNNRFVIELLIFEKEINFY